MVMRKDDGSLNDNVIGRLSATEARDQARS